ncbi:MAG: ACP S-malonyltransferase [Gammaproteobacteria bacterium]|nr:ACP S-malonyltransferase [Gammaproteobacteria bacterium]
MSLAFIFPGQGSQSVGMVGSLAPIYGEIRETYAEASEVLGYDLWDLVANGPEEKLNQTEKTQPAILTASVAIWRIWQSQGGDEPIVMAGHSLGEYSALVAAEVIDFSDAVRLVARRGALMQQAVAEGKGAMAAILGLADEIIQDICSRCAAEGEVLAAVNYNSPGQVVIAGDRAAVERGVAAAQEAGAKRAMLLAVSVPSHCSLMAPAAAALAEELEAITLSKPVISVIHNATVAPAEDADAIRQALVQQLSNPVRWVESIQAMDRLGADTFIECGPGKVLTGLNKRIVKHADVLATYDLTVLRKALGEYASWSE